MDGKLLLENKLCFFITMPSVLLCCLGLLLPMMTAATLPTFSHDAGLPSTRPLVMGHRGECGVYPEQTAASYRGAIDAGADNIECDAVVTKDQELVCHHDPTLNAVTDVADHSEFASLEMIRYVEDYSTNMTGWFTIDLTLAQIKTLRAKQRFDFRDWTFDGQEQLLTLQEYIDIAKGADRVVGIYIEIKNPLFNNDYLQSVGATKTLEDMVLDKLTQNGYVQPEDGCMLQCFNEDSVKYLVAHTSLPVSMLIADDVAETKLTEWADLGVYGVGPSKELITRSYTTAHGYKNYVNKTTFVDQAHSAGLRVHPWTFRNEDHYLALDYRQDPYEEYKLYLDLGIDGYFTDFPRSLKQFLDEAYATEESSAGARIGRGTGVMMVAMGIYLYAVGILY